MGTAEEVGLLEQKQKEGLGEVKVHHHPPVCGTQREGVLAASGKGW